MERDPDKQKLNQTNTDKKRETNKDKKIHVQIETERVRRGNNEVVRLNKGEAEGGGHGDKGERE